MPTLPADAREGARAELLVDRAGTLTAVEKPGVQADPPDQRNQHLDDRGAIDVGVHLAALHGPVDSPSEELTCGDDRVTVVTRNAAAQSCSLRGWMSEPMNAQSCPTSVKAETALSVAACIIVGKW
ncbi:MAG TPA: hypothetical protein VMU34_25810 [Mycobacterium sp.]|nr:hypothetical protein [Mycobacterium sp.]